MQAFILSGINSPLVQVIALPFLLEGDAVDYYHSLTKQVQDNWFQLMRVLGEQFYCIYPLNQCTCEGCDRCEKANSLNMRTTSRNFKPLSSSLRSTPVTSG